MAQKTLRPAQHKKELPHLYHDLIQALGRIRSLFEAISSVVEGSGDKEALASLSLMGKELCGGVQRQAHLMLEARKHWQKQALETKEEGEAWSPPAEESSQANGGEV